MTALLLLLLIPILIAAYVLAESKVGSVTRNEVKR